MIIPNQRVVRSDLQRSTEHDTLVRIIDIEVVEIERFVPRTVRITLREQETTR